MRRLRQLLERYYVQVTGSIALRPTFIAGAFVALAVGVMVLDQHLDGARMREVAPFLSYSDVSTAETILGALVGGILSLLVFSFSMVMIVLGRVAASMTPKVLDDLTRRPAIQRVLGIYVGTVAYALATLVGLQGRVAGDEPATRIGVIVAVALGLLCIALFVYFIHLIAELIKPRNLVSGIARETEQSLREHVERDGRTSEQDPGEFDESWSVRPARRSGYLQGIGRSAVEVARELGGRVALTRMPGEFVLEGTPLFRVTCEGAATDDLADAVDDSIVFFDGEAISENWHYGFRQLAEIAVKALSPGINDPGTALLCIDRVGELLVQLARADPPRWMVDEDGAARVFTPRSSTGEVLEETFRPIRHYGRDDVSVLVALLRVLRRVASLEDVRALLAECLREEASAISEQARAALKLGRDKELVRTELELLSRVDPAFSGLGEPA